MHWRRSRSPKRSTSLPVALHGTLAGSQVREVTFPGKAGQEIICEVEAQRLESKVRPVLESLRSRTMRS